MSVAGLTKLVRAPRLAQRKNAIDHRRELARVNDVRDLGEVRSVGPAIKHCRSNAGRFRFFLGGRLNQRKQNSAYSKNFPGSLLRLPADSVEDNIDIPRDVFEALRAVIDYFVGAELVEQLMIFRRSGRDDVPAFPFRKLHSKVTNSAGAAVDQDALARLQLRRVEQRMPRSQCT